MVDRIKFSIDNANLTEEILEEYFYPGIRKKKSTTYYYKNSLMVGDEEEENEEDEIESDDWQAEYKNNDNKEEPSTKKLQKTKYKKNLTIIYEVYNKPKHLFKPKLERTKISSSGIRNELIIHKNMRKEAYGEGKSTDITYSKFKKEIKKISDKFGIKIDEVLKARVTQIELGVTVILKSDMQLIIPCFVAYKKLPEIITFGHTGVTFLGDNYSVSFYDKLKRILENGEALKKSEIRKRVEPKLRKNNFLLRFEIKINKVTGFNVGNYKTKMNTPKKILDNWEDLGDLIHKMFENVEFVDFLSPEIEVDLKGRGKTEMNKFLQFKGIQKIGEGGKNNDNKDEYQKNHKFFTQYIPNMTHDKIAEFRKYYKKIYEEHLDKSKKDYYSVLDDAIKERLEVLKIKRSI